MNVIVASLTSEKLLIFNLTSVVIFFYVSDRTRFSIIHRLLSCCRLKPLAALQLLVPIQCLTITNGNSHILVGLHDGKLIIVGVKGKIESS